MTEDEMVATILKTSSVKAELVRRIHVVRQYLEQRFFSSGTSESGKGRKDLEEYLSKEDVSEEDKKIIKAFGAEFFRSFTKDNAYDILGGIEDAIKKLATINLYVPIDLQPQDSLKLGEWVRENVDKSILIELHTDTSVFGGCAFAKDGVYHDFSLHHAMKSHTKEVRDILNRYLT